MTDAVQFVGDVPENYDKYMGPNIFFDYAEEIASRAAAAHPSRVLELAAGTGIVSRQLRNKLADDCFLLSTDLNPPMLEVAQSKFDTNEHIQFEAADAMGLSYKDDTFDHIVCQFGVMFFPDKVLSFREAVRVLKPGGAYLFNTWGTLAENLFAQIAQDLAEELFPQDPPGFYQVPFSYADKKKVLSDLKEAGFADAGHDAVEIEKRVDSWQNFARGIVYGNPFAEELRSRGVEPEGVVNLVEERLRKRFGAEPGPMPLKANFFRALAP